MDARTITRQLGGTYKGGCGCAPCPVCQPESRPDQNALSIRDEGGQLLMYCFKSQCSFVSIAQAINMPLESRSADWKANRVIEAKQKTSDTEKLRKARSMWKRSDPISGSKAETYLHNRGIMTELPDTLRFLPDIYHTPSGQFSCAMIANVEPTGGVHRTYFDKRGKRLPKNAKLMLGPCAGGSVRLSVGTGPLVVVEGIETALSVVQMHSEVSPTVWSALSTSGMKSLKLPEKQSELIIAPDGDKAGREAAIVLAHRAIVLGWQVSIMDPGDGLDWNDRLQSEGAA